jgi:hypothetical protein
MKPQDLLPLLYQALDEPFGLLVKVSDVIRAKAAFYRARADANDPALSVIQIRTSPFPDGDLVICKGAPKPLARSAQPRLEDLDL